MLVAVQLPSYAGSSAGMITHYPPQKKVWLYQNSKINVTVLLTNTSYHQKFWVLFLPEFPESNMQDYISSS